MCQCRQSLSRELHGVFCVFTCHTSNGLICQHFILCSVMESEVNVARFQFRFRGGKKKHYCFGQEAGWSLESVLIPWRGENVGNHGSCSVSILTVLLGYSQLVLRVFQLAGLPQHHQHTVVSHTKQSSQDDLDRISRVTSDAPIEIATGSLGRRTLESLQEIERNRHRHLAQQGNVISLKCRYSSSH